MGVYYFFACVDRRGRLVASFNPKHGFGGSKWGEFVGTTRGDRMLSLLAKRYCPDGCRWRVVDDSADGDDKSLYEGIDRVRDFAWNASVRADAVADGIATPGVLAMMDEIAMTAREVFGETPSFCGAAMSELRLRGRIVRRLASHLV